MLRVYDFDKTIFDGDSTARFVGYSLKKRPVLLKKLPRVLYHYIRLALGLEDKTRCKEVLYRALLGDFSRAENEALVEAFWARERGRIKAWYLAQKREDDLIISAGPSFLLEPICRELGVRLICSPVDVRGHAAGANCGGGEKLRRFRAAGFGDPFEFYSDSLVDAPMAAIASKAYRVRGDRISDWPGR